MLTHPLDGRLHARIVGPDAGVDHALQPGVGHRSVGSQATAGGLAGLAGAAGGGGIVESAVGIPGGSLGFLTTRPFRPDSPGKSVRAPELSEFAP